MFGNWSRATQEDRVGNTLSSFGRSAITSETWTWILVAIGVVLRLLEYTDRRLLYMDERALLKNLVELAVFDFTSILTENQLAPPGFLVIERLMVRLPFPVVPAARLVPFLSAIASMFLIRSVARRFLAAHAVPIAVGLFALNDWLLYYSTEIKQYSTELALALTFLLLAAGPVGKSVGKPAAMTRRRMLLLVVSGAVGVWFSFPLSFTLAAIGTLLIAEAALGKQWRTTLGFVCMSLFWAASFAVCYRVSHGILTKDRFIWDWWDFAFLPIPPQSLEGLVRVTWQLLNLLNSPSGVLTPLGVIPSAFLALGLFVLGAYSLGRRSLGGLYLVIAPLPFVIVASALHQYPFHGRLLIFLVPTVHLLVGEGAAALTRKGGAPLTFALGAFLLCQPAFNVVWHRAIAARSHAGYDSHGDLAPDLLDYLESRERERKEALAEKHAQVRRQHAREIDRQKVLRRDVPP
jgi:hypothetical protein